MSLLVAIAAALVIALLRGGSLANLGETRIRWAWLALVALAVQLVLIRFVPAWPGPARVLFPLTHVAIVAVAWLNRGQNGMRLIAAGAVLNLIVMVSNGGFMPIAPEALVQAGFVESIDAAAMGSRWPASKGLVMARGETALWWLSDFIVVQFPIRNVVSIGDVLIAGGLFLFVQAAMKGGD